MIEIRPLNSVHTLGDQDAVIGRFADFEWQRFDRAGPTVRICPPNIQSYYPRPGDPPFEIDAESSQGLWESISAVHHADAVPPSAPSALGKLWVKQIMGCAQIGAEQGGIEIRSSSDEG